MPDEVTEHLGVDAEVHGLGRVGVPYVRAAGCAGRRRGRRGGEPGSNGVGVERPAFFVDHEQAVVGIGTAEGDALLVQEIEQLREFSAGERVQGVAASTSGGLAIAVMRAAGDDDGGSVPDLHFGRLPYPETYRDCNTVERGFNHQDTGAVSPPATTRRTCLGGSSAQPRDL